MATWKKVILAGDSDLGMPTSGGTFSGDIQADGVYIGSTNTSYDLYNNGTTYLNGATIIDDNLTITNGNLGIPNKLYHNDDTGTYLAFTDGQIDLKGSGGVRMMLSDNEAIYFYTGSSTTQALHLDTSQNATFGGDVFVPEYIKHTEDTDTYIRFQTDHIDFHTEDVRVLRLDDAQNATFAGNINLSNNKSINFNNTSGTSKSILAVDSSNITKLGDNSNSGVLQLNAGNATFAGGVTVTAESDSKAGFRLYSNTTLLGGIYNSSGKVHLRGEGDRDVSIGSSNNPDMVVIDTSTGQATFAGSIKGNSTNFDIYQTSDDASDNRRTRIGGGGDVSQSRGAYIELAGNEHTNTGQLILNAGDVSGGDIIFKTDNTTRLTIDDTTGNADFQQNHITNWNSLQSQGNLYLDNAGTIDSRGSGDLTFRTTDSVTTRMVIENSGTISFYGNTGIQADSKALRVGHGNDYTMMHDGTHTYVENLTGELRTYQNSGDHYSVWTKPSGGSITKRLNIAPDGVITAYETLLRSATNNSAGTAWTVIGDGNIPHISIQNASTTNDTMAGLFFKDDQAHRAGIHARFLNHTDGSESAELVFSTATSGNTRERMTISENGDTTIVGSNNYSQLRIKGAGDESGIKFIDSGGTTDGFIYAQGTDIGFLQANGSWKVRHANSLSQFYNQVNITSGALVVTAANDTAAYVYIQADNNDNNADNWRLSAETDGMFDIQSRESGSWASVVEWSGSDKALYPKGNVYLSGTTLSLAGNASTDSYLRFDGTGGDTYLHYNANDMIDVYTGGDIAMRIKDDDVEFNGDVTMTGGLIVNEGGGDNDFRVESDHNTHILHIESYGGGGSQGRVAFGTQTGQSTNCFFHVGGFINTWYGGGEQSGALFNTTVTAHDAVHASGTHFKHTIVEASSGTHTMMSGVKISAPDITSGSATATNAATLYITGETAATVTGGNYAIYAPSGKNLFDDVTVDGDLSVDGGVQIDGITGIGNSSADSFWNSKLVVGAGSSEENLTIYAGGTNHSGLFFADSTSGNGRFSGQIYYNHEVDKMQFATNYSGASSYALEIDSSQNSTFTGEIKTSGSGNGILLGDKSVNGSPYVVFQGTNSNYNWRLRQNDNNGGDFTIKRSTATGGSTWESVPVIQITADQDVKIKNGDVTISEDLSVEGAFPFMIHASADWKGASTEKNMPLRPDGAANATVSTGSDLDQQMTWIAPFNTTLRSLYVTAETACSGCQFKVEVATNYAVYVNDTATTTTTYTKNLTTAGSTNIACGLSISKGNAIRLSIDPNSTAVDQFLVTLVFE